MSITGIATSRTGNSLGRIALRLMWVLVIVGVVAIDILHHLHHPVPSLSADAVQYDGMAQLLLKKHVYNYWLHDVPSAMSMPGYPLFLTLIYAFSGTGPQRFEWVWWVQLILFLVSIYLAYRLGRRLGGETLGIILSAAISVAPFIFLEPFVLLTENLAVPAFLLFLNTFVDFARGPTVVKHYLRVGAMLGILGLIRPSLTVMGIVPLVLLVAQTRGVERLRSVAWFLVACAIPLVPWWIRNAIDFHQFILFDRGESANTILAGTYPGYPTGPESVFQHLAGVDQSALAKQRIKNGFEHHFTQYFLWFTVWRFHYLFHFVYIPTSLTILQRIRSLISSLQFLIVWASVVMVIVAWVSRIRSAPLYGMAMLNLALTLSLIPFHPEPRFAIYNVILCIVFFIGAVYEMLQRGFANGMRLHDR